MFPMSKSASLTQFSKQDVFPRIMTVILTNLQEITGKLQTWTKTWYEMGQKAEICYFDNIDQK